MHADYVFINGEVITVRPDDHVFQAAAVRGNEICAVGTTEEVLDLSGPETQVVDLRGNSLLPGFIDCRGEGPPRPAHKPWALPIFR